jgi:hypothetical protein
MPERTVLGAGPLKITVEVDGMVAQSFTVSHALLITSKDPAHGVDDYESTVLLELDGRPSEAQQVMGLAFNAMLTAHQHGVLPAVFRQIDRELTRRTGNASAR